MRHLQHILPFERVPNIEEALGGLGEGAQVGCEGDADDFVVRRVLER